MTQSPFFLGEMVIKYSLKISLRNKWTDARTDGAAHNARTRTTDRQAKLYASNSAVVACISRGGTEFLAQNHESRILRHSSNPVCGFSTMEQVRLCAVWPMEYWLRSSMNQIKGLTTVRESYSRALEQGPLGRKGAHGCQLARTHGYRLSSHSVRVGL